MDPNTLEGADTGRIGNQSPTFRKLSDTEQLDALLGAPSPEVAAVPDHALDAAPENSKIIVVTPHSGKGRLAVLATPDGPVALPAGDPAHRLPVGSKIYKMGGYFEAILPEEYESATPKRGFYTRAAEVLAHINQHIAGIQPE